jgi:hypothetical protein
MLISNCAHATCLHTFELGGGSYLAEELDKVREVIAEELGLEDEVLAGVVRGQFGA